MIAVKNNTPRREGERIPKYDNSDVARETGVPTVTLDSTAGRNALQAIVQFHRTEKPVRGGVNGVAAGFGFNLALMPDIVLVGDGSTLQFAYPASG